MSTGGGKKKEWKELVQGSATPGPCPERKKGEKRNHPKTLRPLVLRVAVKDRGLAKEKEGKPLKEEKKGRPHCPP